VGVGLKYDLYVKPQADISAIALQYEGIENMRISPSGDLVLKTNVGELVELRPYSISNHPWQKTRSEMRFCVESRKQNPSFSIGCI
jgi:hypothetical protein